MKRWLKFLPLLLIPLMVFSFLALKKKKNKSKYTPKVTYTFSGGRFGDNLLAYLRAKWICYQFHLPLAYKPFPFSKELGIDEKEKEGFTAEEFEEIIPYTNSLYIQGKQRWKKTAYVVPYFPESITEIKHSEDWQYFQVDWKDPSFREEIRDLLFAPKQIASLDLPSNYAKVAIHIRTGRGYDSETAWKDAPLKFPPMTYYAEELQKLSSVIDPEKKLYVRIFTDDPNPEMITNYLQKIANLPHVEYHYVLPEQTGVLEDFFAMMQYDYMIRADSNISTLACLLHDYQIAIHPAHFTFKNGKITIDQVKWSWNSQK